MARFGPRRATARSCLDRTDVARTGSASPAALPPQVTCTVALERDGGPTRYHRTVLDPQDVAEAVAFLSAPASDYINGHELRVDGGQVPIDSWRLDTR